MKERGKQAKKRGETFATKNIVVAWESYIRNVCGKGENKKEC